MKCLSYLLLMVLLLPIYSFAQISQDSIEEIAQDYFEEVTVQEKFKDPYSYELMKIWSEPVNQGTMDIRLLDHWTAYANSRDMPRKMRKMFKEKSAKLLKTIENKSKKEMSQIGGYDIYIDARGSNSYGNPVLSRYRIGIRNNGDIFEALHKHDR